MHERPQDTRGITPGGWSRSSRRIKPPKQRDPLDNASLHRILIPHTVPCSPDAIREILHYSSSDRDGRLSTVSGIFSGLKIST